MFFFLINILLFVTIFLGLYIIIQIIRTCELNIAQAIGLLGICVTIYLGLNANSLPPSQNSPVTPSNTATSTNMQTSVLPPTVIKQPALTLIPTNTSTDIYKETETPIPTAAKIVTPIIIPTKSIPTPTYASKLDDNQDVRIRVQGIGVASENSPNDTVQKRTALLAAEIDAKRQLAEWSDGAIIESVTIVDLGMLTTDRIRQIIRAKVPKHQIIDEQFDIETNTGYVTLELIMKSEP